MHTRMHVCMPTGMHAWMDVCLLACVNVCGRCAIEQEDILLHPFWCLHAHTCAHVFVLYPATVNTSDRVNSFKDTCMPIYINICIIMCIDTCIDMCTDVFVYRLKIHLGTCAKTHLGQWRMTLCACICARVHASSRKNRFIVLSCMRASVHVCVRACVPVNARM